MLKNCTYTVSISFKGGNILSYMDLNELQRMGSEAVNAVKVKQLFAQRKIRTLVTSVILFFLFIGLGVPAFNAITSNPETHITERTCSNSSSCSAPNQCFNIPERYGGGAKCVEPGYIESSCGLFELPLIKTSIPPTLACPKNIIGGIYIHVLS